MNVTKVAGRPQEVHMDISNVLRGVWWGMWLVAGVGVLVG